MPDWEKEATSNITILTKILKYHVLNGKVLSSDLKNELLVPTLEGQEVRLNIYPNSVVSKEDVVLPETLQRIKNVFRKILKNVGCKGFTRGRATLCCYRPASSVLTNFSFGFSLFFLNTTFYFHFTFSCTLSTTLKKKMYTI